jgi:hypothetical protein
MSEDLERAIGPGRRAFIKRLVVGTVFVAPVVASFTMAGAQALFGAQAGPVRGLANPNTTVTTSPPAEVSGAITVRPRVTG